MNHLDVLKQYLSDNDKFISYRWLANELQINVDVAKKVMNEYINEYPDINLNAMYCISGIINDTNEYQILIVPYKLLDTTKKRFSSISGTHIYSLQHKLPSNIASQLKNCDSIQAKDLLLLRPTCEFFLLNKLGSVINSDINIKPIGQRYIIAQMHAESIKDPIKSSIPNPPASKGSKKVNATDFFNSTKASNAATGEKKKADKLKELDDILDFSSSKSNKSKNDNTIKSIGGDDGNDAEWDDGTGYQTNKDKLKKRKAIDIPDADDDDEDEGKSQKIDEETVVIDEEDEKENKNVVKKAHTHGAMDDYMEDIAIAKHLADPSGEIVVKKTKKKLVQKTVCDEKSGYIETVFEYEEVTDDEDEKQKEKQEKTISKIAPPKVVASKSNKKGSPDKKNNQKSMMSFFGAKK